VPGEPHLRVPREVQQRDLRDAVHSIVPRRARSEAHSPDSFAAIVAAAPIPTMPATFSVPARYPISWNPPNVRGATFVPSRTLERAGPLRAVELCADKVRRSAGISATSRGMCPAEAVASTWNVTPASPHNLPISPPARSCRSRSWRGITDTSRVSGRGLCSLPDPPPPVPVHRDGRSPGTRVAQRE